MYINMLFKRSIIIQTPLCVGDDFEFKPRLACGVIEAKRPGMFSIWQTNLKIQHPPVGFQASRLHFPTLFADLDLLNCQTVNAKSETKITKITGNNHAGDCCFTPQNPPDFYGLVSWKSLFHGESRLKTPQCFKIENPNTHIPHQNVLDF